MSNRFWTLFAKELRQITRSRRTALAASLVPALMLVLVTTGDILTLRMGFGSHPIYLLSSARPLSAEVLLRHYTLPILVTISALVTPSIVMGDVLLGERERRTLELLIALPVSAREVTLAKLAAVLIFALATTGPLFVVHLLIVATFGYGSPGGALSLAVLLLAGIAYSATSALVVALVAGEPRAANIVSGLVLGPVVPAEGLILATVPGEGAVRFCATALACVTAVGLVWASRMLTFERLFGAS